MKKKNASSSTIDTERFSVYSTIKSYPDLPYEGMKNRILGKKYELSLVFVGEKRAQKINESARGKTYVPNVLSFPLTDTIGEIIICPKAAAKEAASFNLSVEGYIGYLCIHGLLHLKGFDHGVHMDKLEEKHKRYFKLT